MQIVCLVASLNT